MYVHVVCLYMYTLNNIFTHYRSQGRIVEALVNDFVALVGTGILTVVIQNTGYVTADYAVRIHTLNLALCIHQA